MHSDRLLFRLLLGFEKGGIEGSVETAFSMRSQVPVTLS
jgi:hypothetical protein